MAGKRIQETGTPTREVDKQCDRIRGNSQKCMSLQQRNNEVLRRGITISEHPYEGNFGNAKGLVNKKPS